jgi:hypothetical protein
MSVKRVVYTALLGGYEDLIEQTVAAGSGVDFICFTDDPKLTSTTWQVRLVQPLFPFDMVRSQRDLKIRGHDDLAGYDEILYIDNAVYLRQNPADILSKWLAEHDYAVAPHSFRERVIDEFDEVLALSYDDPARVSEQLLHYAELYPDVLEQQPYWNGMSARRNTPEVGRMMNLWFDHVLRFSRRDQLSANVAFALGGVAINKIDENNNDAPSHQWPAGVNRRTHLTAVTRRRAGPILAELRRVQLERDKFVLERDTLRWELDESVRLGNDEMNRLAQEKADVEFELHRLGSALYQAQTREAASVVLFGAAATRRLARIFRVLRRLQGKAGSAAQQSGRRHH